MMSKNENARVSFLIVCVLVVVLWAMFADSSPFFDCGYQVPTKSCHWWVP